MGGIAGRRLGWFSVSVRGVFSKATCLRACGLVQALGGVVIESVPVLNLFRGLAIGTNHSREVEHKAGCTEIT